MFNRTSSSLTSAKNTNTTSTSNITTAAPFATSTTNNATTTSTTANVSLFSDPSAIKIFHGFVVLAFTDYPNATTFIVDALTYLAVREAIA
eukprot:CAMPEP_0169065660 /NCGR_PEP_ID=MMETSP1015-20121227/2524_1 /TAXON_ID=342587 /ORGANISM="Karlodinium micrum, Strain CCMP2283" /LENGTH=90 /DNA_ID=CAMNT_0009124253 /DNA_START=855 /DNA_END=1124 /DNA_ORIENTATION=+